MTDPYESIRKMQPKLIKLLQELERDTEYAERYRRLRENCSVLDVVRAEGTDEPYERTNAALQDQEKSND